MRIEQNFGKPTNAEESPENNPVPASTKFIAELRNMALGDNPSSAEELEFEKSVGGHALSVLEVYNRVRTEHPEIKDKIVGRALGSKHGEQATSMRLSVGNDYTISALENGTIKLEGSQRGGDNFLMYETDMTQGGLRPGLLHDIEINLATGESEPALTEQTSQRLTRILGYTRLYYDNVLNVMARMSSQDRMIDVAFPQFPKDKVEAWRRHQKEGI